MLKKDIDAFGANDEMGVRFDFGQASGDSDFNCVVVRGDERVSKNTLGSDV